MSVGGVCSLCDDRIDRDLWRCRIDHGSLRGASTPVDQRSEQALGERLGLRIALAHQGRDATLRRILLDAKLQPHRQKMWLTSHDDEFRAKRDDVLHLYYDTPPTNTLSASTKRPASRRWSAAIPTCPWVQAR